MKEQLIKAVLQSSLSTLNEQNAIRDCISYLVDFQPDIAEIIAGALIGVRPEKIGNYQVGGKLLLKTAFFSSQAANPSVQVTIDKIDWYNKKVCVSGEYPYIWRQKIGTNEDGTPKFEEKEQINIINERELSFSEVNSNAFVA